LSSEQPESRKAIAVAATAVLNGFLLTGKFTSAVLNV